MALSAEQMDDITTTYERDGVVTIAGLLSPDNVSAYRSLLDAFVRDNLATLPPEDYVLEPDGTSVRNLWRLEAHCDAFRALSLEPRMLDLVRPLVRGEPVVMGVESFNKPARVGSPVPPHQDNAYFCLRPADALTLWIALDPVTEENGPVRYLRGSHRAGLRAHAPSGVAGNSMGLRDALEDHTPFTGLLAPGDALIHHCETIHYSAANTSDRARCGLLIVYKGAQCVKDDAMHAAYAMARQ